MVNRHQAKQVQAVIRYFDTARQRPSPAGFTFTDDEWYRAGIVIDLFNEAVYRKNIAKRIAYYEYAMRCLQEQ